MLNDSPSFYASLITVLISILLIALVSRSKSSTKIKISYLSIAMGLSLWLVLLFLSNVDTTYVEAVNRGVYIPAAVLLTGFSVFIDEIASERDIHTAEFKGFNRYIHNNSLLAAVTIMTFSVIAMPSTIQGVAPRISAQGIEGFSINYGPTSGLLVLLFLFLMVISIARVRTIYTLTKERTLRSTLRLILLTVLFSLLTGSTTNLILPVLGLGGESTNTIGVLSSLLFIGVLAYTILFREILNLKAIVARSLTYSFSLLTLLGVFVAFGVTVGNFLTEGSLTTGELITFFILSLGMIVLAPILRNFFDQLTTRLFFRDAYDSQVVLNNLSDLIVREIELTRILYGSKEILNGALKPQSMHFSLLDNDEQPYATDLSMVKRLPKALYTKLKHYPSPLIITDEIPAGNELKKQLLERDIALIQRLNTGDSLVGYLVLGDKKSGSGYSSQDRQLINVAGNELALATQNARSFEEIKAFNETLVAEIEKATRNLKKSNAKLKALDEAKDEFISMASHQLRTPLTSIKGYLSMVLEGDAGEVKPTQEKMLEEAFTSSQRMVYLIADLLNVSRLKTGKFTIEKSVVDLGEVVASEIHQLDEMLKARDLKMKLDIEKGFPTELHLDETKTRQVIMNFIDNAIYYTPSGGKITVKLSSTTRSVKCEVIDTGIGVSPKEQKHLFTKFFRATNARKARPDGTGLGLFMAQKVISAQGGAVVFNSKLGKGSTFGFTFPMKAVRAPKTKKTTSKK